MPLFFGPNNTYLFTDRMGTHRWRTSENLAREMQSAYHLSYIIYASLGEGDSWFMSYATRDVTISIAFDLKGRYGALHRWLHEDGWNHNGETVRVSLGMDGAFFASSDQGYRWHGIPAELYDKLYDIHQACTRPHLFTSARIRTVALGYEGTFIGHRWDGARFWNLKDQYSEFQSLRLLPGRWANSIEVASISAFAPNQHCIIFSNGTVHLSIPPEWEDDLVSLFQDYAQSVIRTGVASTAASAKKGTQLSQRSSQASVQGSASATGSKNHTTGKIDPVQKLLDIINNYNGTGTKGMRLESKVASSGKMVGHLTGKYAGSCTVM